MSPDQPATKIRPLRAGISSHGWISSTAILQKIISFFTAALLTCQSFELAAQPLTYLPLVKLETKDGLSSPNVRKIMQDHYGFMWFATQDGLNRYDGVGFERYISASPSAKRTIPSGDAYDLALEDNGNFLWCLTAYGGLTRIDTRTGSITGTFPVATHPRTKEKLWFTCMAIKKNRIYIGTHEGLVISFNITTGKTETLTPVTTDPAQHLDKIYADDYNRVWLLIAEDGLRVMDTTLTRQVAYLRENELFRQPVRNSQFTDICRVNDELLICAYAGMAVVRIREMVPAAAATMAFSIPSFITDSKVHCVSAAGKDILIASEKGLFSISKDKGDIKEIRFSKNYDDRNWLTLTNCVLQINETIWIGSQYGVGWIKNINTPFSGFFTSMNGNGTKIDHSVGIVALNDSSICICGDDGLYFANHISGVVSKFSRPDFYYHAFKFKKDYIIASGMEGICLIDKDRRPVPTAQVFPELDTIKEDLIAASAFLDDSICFMVSQWEKGIYIWNYRTRNIQVLSTRSAAVKLKSNIINNLFLDSKKRLWIVGDNAVSVYDHYNRAIRHLDLVNPRNHEPLSINMDICEAGGKFWMATYGTGIVELSESGKINQIYSVADSINNLGLYKIFRYNDSTILASSNNGLLTLNIRTGKIANYFEEEGLHSNNFEEFSGCESDRYFFLGGIKGYTRVAKTGLRTKTALRPVSFSSIQLYFADRILDTSDLSLKKLEVDNQSFQVVINIANLNYGNVASINFQYRLKELGNSWSSLGTKRFISLIRNNPGTYHLEVRATDEEGNFSPPAELIVVFLPKWYQTWIFKLALVLAGIAIIYGLYRIRINQLKKEQNIRTRLASDLHDDLGSTMNSVKIYVNLAILEKQPEKYLFKIKENIQEAINGIKDTIWVLDDRKDTVEDLFSRISLFAVPLCDANNIIYKQEIADDARAHRLGQEEKRNLYMMLKEAVNNAVKYSDAGNITISATVRKGKLSITIKDTGKGFDAKKSADGNGLRNMQRRAHQIKYDIRIDTAPGCGTSIYIRKI